jgi:uncharacterized protein YaiL (DUF2058 family)
MSTSLRDQLLKAGLINKKQANEAERQQQLKERHGGAKRTAPPAPAPARASAPQAAKVARDLALNRRQQEKAERKARLAQIKQLIEQNRLPPAEGDPPYNFVDGGKIRKIPVATAHRDALGRGAIAIVRHEGRYELVPSAIAARIRERDEHAVITLLAAPESTATDDAYAGFTVPDDLIW